MLHHTAITISSKYVLSSTVKYVKYSNLSFTASVPDLPLFYNMVGLPEHGVVECSPEHGHFAICGKFSQSQVIPL